MEQLQVAIGIHSLMKGTGVEDGLYMDLEVQGTLENRDGVTVISYEKAADEESDQMQQVTIFVEKDLVTVNQTGDMVSQLAFRLGQRSIGYYQTPFGTLEVGIFTTLLNWTTYQENPGEQPSHHFNLEYQLEMNGVNAGHHTLFMTIDPRKV